MNKSLNCRLLQIMGGALRVKVVFSFILDWIQRVITIKSLTEKKQDV